MKSGDKGAAAPPPTPWTKADDDTVRADYPKTKRSVLAARLGRSVRALQRRAGQLGVKAYRPWTSKDDHDLIDSWGELTIAQIARNLKRTPEAVYARATEKLGLKRGCPEGFEYVSNAAKRTGFDLKTLWKVLAYSRVKVARAMSRPGKARGHYQTRIVDPYAVDRAVRAFIDAAPLNQHAIEHRLDLATLKRWLLLAKEHGAIVDLPPLPKKQKGRWRVPGATVAAALAWKATLETLTAAAARVGLSRETLKPRLLRAGVVPIMVGRTHHIKRADVDRVSKISNERAAVKKI